MTTKGWSGKYQAEPLRGREDIMKVLRAEEGGRGGREGSCLVVGLRDGKPPFGALRNGIWYLQIAALTAAGRRRIMTAVEVLWNFYYPHSTIRHHAKVGGGLSRKLRRECGTKGCVNYKHYEIVNRDGVTFGESYMAMGEVIELLTRALSEQETLTFGDEASADSFRMHIYRLKRKWKKEGSHYSELFEDVVIKKDRLHGNILDFTSRGREFGGVLARFRKDPEEVQVKALGEGERDYFENAILQRDPADKAMKDWGYGTEAPPPPAPRMSEETFTLGEDKHGLIGKQEGEVGRQTAFTYEAANAKAVAASMAGGEALTPEEEELLRGGAPSEG